MIYLDTGILVRGLILTDAQHAECVRLINEDAVSSCHSFAEVFNTITGFFRIQNDIAAEMVKSLAEQMSFETITQNDYLKVVGDARQRGIQGGIIYDALHAEIARRLKVSKIVTYNITNFRHVAPDVLIIEPTAA